MFFHVLSLSFIFFHFLTCSFMFFYCLSLSFIVFHCLSFSLSLLGAQNLFFLGLNFVTISLDNSYVKNQFVGPSRVLATPLWALFSFFFPSFFSRFLSFFLLFICSFFFFRSFLHFLIFLCFSFSLYIFSEEKVSSFLFLLFLSNIFNCWL